MKKRISCPACGATGLVSDDSVFEVRGVFEGKPVRRCQPCGAGLFLKLVGRPQLIPSTLWERMQESWGRHKESQNRRFSAGDPT